jgi:hypothetical protein
MPQDRYRTLPGRIGYYIYDYEKYTLAVENGVIIQSETHPDFMKIMDRLNAADRIQKVEAAKQKAEQEKVWAANIAARDAAILV